ncbi:MAG: hypothetical protein IKU26_00835 [Clostridia bacterium]|nr:hypothetical protein [Clostridia bacterium]
MVVKLKPVKTIEKQWKSYLKSLEKGGYKSPKMEALRPFMGKSGNVLKRQTRSNRQKAAFNKAAEGVKETFGTSRPWSKKPRQSEKHSKQQATREKTAAKEYQRKQKKKIGGKLTKGAKKYVEEQQRKYDEMLDILTVGSQKMLSSKVRYEIYVKMDAENVSAEDIENFIKKLLATLNDIPEEAQELAKQDGYISALQELAEFSSAEMADFSAMFTAMTSVDVEDQENISNAIRYWQDPENNQSHMGFEQFWNELQTYNDLGNEENYREILQEED